ncbi:peptide-methionine (S)-S-oxide reductase MsrA [Litoreibacter arenae]|uniref:Peptide methionine sulfoxide reductase MsrA n=1 Tax=Litoreibacter arenae DSM 19593 TaxID=1123360 RepID=S9QCX9_9RHOB|nr:peptide-methionine (S)-S-oxide reductase MsrA [Litoreibacter arenae]EPX77458.1 Peptide methionine sulfoxide reductase MsrA [Litoreibacter arenae DSM 19593]
MPFLSRTRWYLTGFGLAVLAGVATQPNLAKAAEITVAGGCFWCVEADFEKVRGVNDAVSGFTGGTVPSPTYKQVTSGGTGHLEAVQIDYDPETVSARQLYDLFFRSIDPTDSGGQFCDRGESYTTAIFVTNRPDREAAEAAKAAAEKELGQKIVTPIRDADSFFPADDYHQNYYKQDKTILTRFGPQSKAKAYKKYRDACGRDERVKELWGDAAPFVN